MSRRKEANRAEAIVRGVGAFIMVLLLALLLFALPHILKGKNTQEMMDTMMHIIIGFASLSIITGVIGVVVWLKVLKGKKKGKED